MTMTTEMHEGWTVRPGTAAEHRARIERVLADLESRLDQAPDLEELARRAAYARHHFHRVFRGVTGESVLGYVRRLRLERAARRLRGDPSLSVTELAFEAGYESLEAFSRAFARRFGASPSEHREQPAQRQPALPPLPVPPVELRREEATPVWALRHRGAWDGVGTAFKELVSRAQRAGLAAPRLVGLCPDDPEVTPEPYLRFDACVVSSAPPPGSLVSRAIPAGRYAVAVHQGGYDTLSETYLALIGHWWPSTAHRLADEPVVEVYLDDPATTPVEQLRTEVRVRVMDE